MRIQPSPKMKERRAMRIIIATAGLSTLVFSISFLYLNIESKTNAYAENTSSSLPLMDNILNFNGVIIPEGVRLNWCTSEEVNNDYFTLERSTDGINFEAVDNIDGAGNTKQPVQYNYVDDSPSEGINYYRLAQTDFDGSQKTYESISVKLDENTPALSVMKVYPNPFNGDFLLTYHSSMKTDTKVDILNADGKNIYSEVLKSDSGTNLYDFNNKMLLEQGTFFVTLSQGKIKTEAVRIVKK